MAITPSKLLVLLTFLSLHTISAANELQFQVRATFQLRSDVHMRPEEKAFANDCLKLSFESSYKPDEVVIKQADFKSLLSTPQKTPTNSHGTEEQRSDHASASTWLVDCNVQATCPHCHVSNNILWTWDNIADQHHNWETILCETLQSGPFDVFRDAANCQIVVHSDVQTAKSADVVSHLATTGGSRHVVFNVRASFSLPSDEEMTDDEVLFTNESLRLAYDEVHQNDGVVTESANLKRHFSVPRVVLTKVGKYTPSRYMDMTYTYIWIWEMAAACRYCAVKDNSLWIWQTDAEDASIVAKRSKMEQGRWEEVFCDKLRSGPFDKYQPLKQCYIEIYAEDAVAAAAK